MPQRKPPADAHSRYLLSTARADTMSKLLSQMLPAAGEECAPEPKRILSETLKLQIHSRHPLGTEIQHITMVHASRLVYIKRSSGIHSLTLKRDAFTTRLHAALAVLCGMSEQTLL